MRMPTILERILELIEEKKRQRDQIDEVIRQLEGALKTEQGGGPSKEHMTTLQMAEGVLREAKQPLHAKEIAKLMQSKYGVFEKHTSVGTMLWRSAVQGKKTVFRKDKEPNNTHSLLEWK
jgi:HB1, ASXL, restriction endonuclease HTH domain